MTKRDLLEDALDRAVTLPSLTTAGMVVQAGLIAEDLKAALAGKYAGHLDWKKAAGG